MQRSPRVARDRSYGRVLPNTANLFAAYHDTYFENLEKRRAASHAKASSEREKILLANAQGRENFWLALRVAVGFLVLMFFFLLIAIERHQRRIAKIG